MTTRYLVIAAFAVRIMSTLAHHASANRDQDNQAPVVKIQSPTANTTVSANTPIRYEITVADREDGDSRYDEINPKEIMLEIRAAASAKSTSYPASKDAGAVKSSPLESPGLALMARSNCFNCHQFSGKGIGPSLANITRRYQNTAATIDTLSKRIKDGSVGIWGKEKMPSHPEVGIDDIHAMVRWIEKYAAAPGVIYQNGTPGILQFPGVASPGSPAAPGTYTLTAAYTDHGTKDTKTGPYLTGLDQMTLTVK
jgi:cytochrome c